MQKICFSKEMGFTREEFERTLPAALNQRPFSKTAGGFQATINTGSLELVVSEQKYRKIASISLPYLNVDFTFSGLSEFEVEQTMRFFDLRFQRGGG
ncbi:MAG: hypothetical protein AAF404_05095 [Pseudomonadota bacterium]